MDVREINRRAWNRAVELGNRWTIPVSAQAIAAARRGEWAIHLTPNIPVPQEWYPQPLRGRDVLCLASGGGQQGPILAAAGAKVTVFDNSPRQLARDQEVAAREGLLIRTVEGDMRDLSLLDSACFDLVFHPVSNNFVPEVRSVWREAYRVLRQGGVLLAAFGNPWVYIFDIDALEYEARFDVRYPLPFSDLELRSPDEIEDFVAEGRPLEFSHTLDDQIGGQIDAGFLIAGFYEDRNPPEEVDLLGKFVPTYIATRAIKPGPW